MKKAYGRETQCKNTGNYDRCPYVEFLRDDNITTWQAYCEAGGDTDLIKSEKLFSYMGIPQSEWFDTWKGMKIIKNAFEKLQREKAEQRKFDSQLGNYRAQIRGRK